MKIAHILSIIVFSLVFAIGVSLGAETYLHLSIHPAIIALPSVSYGFACLYGFVPMPKYSLMTNFGAIANFASPDIDGREAMGGYTATAYLAFISDIETFPTEPDITTATDVGQLVTLGGNYVMKAGKYFFPIKVPPQTSKLSPQAQGELGGKSFKISGEFFVPGIDDQSMGMARMLNNKMGVIVFTDPDGKNRIVAGSKDLPCTFTPKGDSGAKGTDKKGFTYTFEADSFAPGWKYDGLIPLSGSNIAGIS